MNNNGIRPIEILLVEDSPADVRLTQEALKEEKFHVNLSVVNDGVEAMEFLLRQGNYEKAVRPDLITCRGKTARKLLRKLKTTRT